MKTNRLQHMFSLALLGVMVISSSLIANEQNEETETTHITVGERAMSHVDAVKIQEKRARIFQKVENGEDLSDEEDVDLSQAEQQELLGQESLASSQDEEGKETSVQAGKLISKNVNATTYYTTHEGAFHHPIGVSLLGDSVELEDGSIWAVCSNHRYLTLDWMTGDVIVIVPNHEWFSAFNYKLVNINTGAKVKVNLSLGPIYNGLYTHWILAIDYYNREICLEDGSVWSMSSVDSSVVNSWLVNDTVIIGIHDGWFSGSNPNILINVNMNNYAIGSCIY